MQVPDAYMVVTERRAIETVEVGERSATLVVAKTAGHAIVFVTPSGEVESNGPPVLTIGPTSGPIGRSVVMGDAASASPISRLKNTALANSGRASGRESGPTRPSGRGGPISVQIGGERRAVESRYVSCPTIRTSGGRATTENGSVSVTATANRVVAFGPIGQKSTSISSTGHQQ